MTGDERKPPAGAEKRGKPGPDPERLKIPEEAAEAALDRLLRKGKPPGSRKGEKAAEDEGGEDPPKGR